MSAEQSGSSNPEVVRVAREALSAAVRANDAAQVALVIEQYPSLRSQLDDPLVPDHAFGATPLLAAVYNGNREMIDVLLRAGASINARSHWWAGSFGVLDAEGDLAPFLIERGATVDAHAAARLGMIDRLRELVSAKPELVHARGGDGKTPLHCAASIEIAEYLVDRGANIDARDVDHESTPAMYMVRDRQDIARWLIGRGCQTDILMTTAVGDIDRVRRHIQTDPSSVRTTVSEEYFPKRDPRSGGCIYTWTLGRDKSAHAIAREFGHGDIFDRLAAHTPAPAMLAVACELGDKDLATSLLGSHPDLAQALDEHDRRKIANAARDNDVNAVRLMLAAGWPVDARGQHGGTPLHWAAWNGNTVMAQDLVARGAKLDVVDDDFHGTPLMWAVYGSVHGWRCKTGDYAGTADALLRAGAPPLPRNDRIDASEAVRQVLQRYGDAT